MEEGTRMMSAIELISETIRKILEKKTDPIEGVRNLHILLGRSKLSNHEVYLRITGIESQIDHFIVGKQRKLFSEKYLKKQDLERHYLLYDEGK